MPLVSSVFFVCKPGAAFGPQCLLFGSQSLIFCSNWTNNFLAHHEQRLVPCQEKLICHFANAGAPLVYSTTPNWKLECLRKRRVLDDNPLLHFNRKAVYIRSLPLSEHLRTNALLLLSCVSELLRRPAWSSASALCRVYRTHQLFILKTPTPNVFVSCLITPSLRAGRELSGNIFKLVVYAQNLLWFQMNGVSGVIFHFHPLKRHRFVGQYLSKIMCVRADKCFVSSMRRVWLEQRCLNCTSEYLISNYSHAIQAFSRPGRTFREWTTAELMHKWSNTAIVLVPFEI